MMQLLRKILHSLRPTLLLFLLVGAALCLWCSNHRAIACWNIVETQCFSQNPVPLNWGANGWQHPTPSNRYWKRWPNYPFDYVTISAPSWDWQREYFDDHMCADEIGQALWCAGYPRGNDPRYTNYPPRDTAYVTYGPIDLSQAVHGGCTFYLYSRSEIAHDSLFWGLTTAQRIHQNHDSVYIAGTFSQVMPDIEFQQHVMDFSQLHRIGTTDTVSLLGRSQVWVYWRFWSDANTNVDIGSFIDNVTISWDDGGIDLAAQCGSGAINHMDGTPDNTLQAGDTVFTSLPYTTCSGDSASVYPPFRAVVLMDTMVIQDTMISDARQGVTYTLNTHPWVLSPDTHRIYMVLDSMNADSEVNESNDTCSFTFVVPRPHPAPSFTWIAPLDSIEYGDLTATLRWEAYDDPSLPQPATLSFFSSTQNLGCQGVPVPGGTARPVIDGEDSLVWNLAQYYYGRILYVFVRVHDAYNDTCIYAPYPIVRRPSSAVGDGIQNLIPDHFYLDQNYPNPFNPTTELRFGLAKSGHTALRVYDLLGREVVTLVNGERSAGIYTVMFDGSKLPSGLYLYSLTAPEGTQSRKMMLMK